MFKMLYSSNITWFPEDKTKNKKPKEKKTIIKKKNTLGLLQLATMTTKVGNK